MKKILLGALCVAGTAAAGSNNTIGEPIDAMRGLYAGAGVQYSRVSNRNKVTDGVTANGDPLSYDIGRTNQKKNQFGGSLVIGYGQCFGSVYFGGEVLVDFADEVTFRKVGTSPVAMTCIAKINGVTPEAAVRCGWWFPSFKSLIYAKGGIDYMRTEFQENSVFMEQKTRRMNKITPIIGIGLEKIAARRINLRGEFSYVFPIKNRCKTTLIGGAATFNVKNRMSKFTLRLMLVCRL